MAKVHIEDGWLDIRVSWLERLLLSEKPRRLRLSSVESVNPHPPLLDMLLYWTDQRGVWLAGATTHEGYLVPSTRNPHSTLAIQVEGQPLWYVELDDQEPCDVAAQIERELGTRPENTAPVVEPPLLLAQVGDLGGRAVVSERQRIERELDEEEDDVRLRDPRHQREREASPRHFRLHDDRDLSRLGKWLLAGGSFAMLGGTTIVAAGLLSGLVIVGAGLASAVIGGLTLGLVAHHQG